MAGPAPAIHVFVSLPLKDVGARHAAGYDEAREAEAVGGEGGRQPYQAAPLEE
jgi:hypothetical protein